MEPEERAREGVFLAFQYPGRDPRREQHLLPEGGAQRRAEAPRRSRSSTRWSSWSSCSEKLKLLRHRSESVEAPGQRGLLGRREEAQRDLPDGACSSRRSPFSTRPTRASTSTRSRPWPTASTRCVSPDRAIVVVTHYQRLLNYIVPDFVHVLSDGRIVKSGGKELALRARGQGLRLARRRAEDASPRRMRISRWQPS